MSQTLSSPDAATPVLFVDDDADVQKAVGLLLPRHGFALIAARTPEQCWSLLASQPVRLVLLDLNFSPGATSGAEGLELLDALLAHDPGLSVVVITAHSGINVAVAAMRAGAADFVMKPWHNDRLVATLRGALQGSRCRNHAAVLPPPRPEDGPLLGACAAIVAARAMIARVAPTAAPVLVCGPAGTGKSLAVRLLHRSSPRAGRSLCVVDPSVLWAEGEASLHQALAALDPRDTLLLDNVDELPLPVQARLLALLDRLHGLRVLSTCRSDVGRLSGGMQAELLARLSLVTIALPPLASREEDAALLAAHFVGLFAGVRTGLVLSEASREALLRAAWPDNVRGLRQAAERAVLLCEANRTVIEPGDLVANDAGRAIAADSPTLRSTERAMVEAALRRHGFNVSRAAVELGLTRTALYRRMARHGL